MNARISDVETAEDHGIGRREVVLGLDTLRFVTAMWVAFSHGARFPVERVIQPDTAFHKLLYLLNNTTFNGTAAVAVFFLISGFLIHGANLGKSRVPIIPFWIRRMVRIGIPLAIVIVAARVCGVDYVAALDRILWSVFAEMVYYALYPLLLPVIHRYGIGRVLTGSLAVSLIMIALHPTEIYLWSFRSALTWLFCAPLWLMGCYLAEHRQRIARISRRIPIWLLRLVAVGYCYGSTILATHMGDLAIGYSWTIWFFGAFCIVWLDAEMRRGTGKAPVAWLERFGLAGYSLYLTHRFAITYVHDAFAALPPVAYWLATLAAVLALTWLFYRLVEWPSHRIARYLGRLRKA